MPLRIVTEAGRSVRLRCSRIPLRLALPLSPEIETSTGPLRGRRSPHSSAALRWLSAAPQYSRIDIVAPGSPRLEPRLPSELATAPPGRTGEHRRDPTALAATRRVTDGIYPSVKPVQPATLHPVPNRGSCSDSSLGAVARSRRLHVVVSRSPRVLHLAWRRCVVHIAHQVASHRRFSPARPNCSQRPADATWGGSGEPQTAKPAKTRIVPPHDFLRFQLAAYECRRGTDDRFAETGGRSTDGRTCRI